MPTVAAEPLICLIDAYAARARAVDALDSTSPLVSAGVRRADGLLAVAEAAALHRDSPAHGGDRPRIVVTVDSAELRREAAGARLLGTGEPIPAGELRRLLCDADVLPAATARRILPALRRYGAGNG